MAAHLGIPFVAADSLPFHMGLLDRQEWRLVQEIVHTLCMAPGAFASGSLVWEDGLRLSEAGI